MRLGARADDWHADNPDVKPVLWIISIIGMVALAIIIAGSIGGYLNGNGSPFLS